MIAVVPEDWTVAMVERNVRGVLVWVEEVYARAPKFKWSCECGADGRAKTVERACAGAERHVRRDHEK